MRSSFVLAAVCLLVCPAWATEQKENHPDGSLHFRVPLNAKGQRHGVYTAYFPGGKKIQEKAHYENGQLSGIRETFDEKGKPIAEEVWVNGLLVCPKSVRMIDAARTQSVKDATTTVQKMGKPTNPNAPSPESLAKMLGKLNFYRYLCDLPNDVVPDDRYIDVCQHGAEVLEKIGKLDHQPRRPTGTDEKSYKLGYEGCSHSNLHAGGDGTNCVDSFMNDSDSGNIDRIGHRRWLLNPAMAKTGFGTAGQFTAMYSFDASRENVPDFDFVCFPPRGYCPANVFRASFAWHVTVNPAKYEVDDGATLAIWPVDIKLKRAPSPLEMNYKHVDRGGFGIPNAIIARPAKFTVRPDTLYEVLVSGVKTSDGQKAELKYFVSFY